MGTVFRLVIPQPTLALQISAGYPLLTFQPFLSGSFELQYSANLGDTVWATLLSLTNLSPGRYSFADPAGVAQPQRFYRALSIR
jgi:hypothetical protein